MEGTHAYYSLNLWEKMISFSFSLSSDDLVEVKTF